MAIEFSKSYHMHGSDKIPFGQTEITPLHSTSVALEVTHGSNEKMYKREIHPGLYQWDESSEVQNN